MPDKTTYIVFSDEKKGYTQYYVNKLIELPNKRVILTFGQPVGYLSDEELKLIDQALRGER